MKNHEVASEDEMLNLIPEDKSDYLPEAYLHSSELRQELLGIIESLPDGMRSCVLYYYYKNMKIAEIAAVMGITESAVSKQLARAREKISSSIQKGNPTAYTHALLPMGALSQLFSGEAALLAPMRLVRGCFAAAQAAGSFGTALWGALAAKAAVVVVSGTLVVGGIIGVSSIFSASKEATSSSPQGLASSSYSQKSEDNPVQSLPASTPGRPAGVATDPDPAAVTNSIAGRVELVSNTGEVVTDVQYAAGMRVRLTPPGGTAQLAEVAADGQFSFVFEGAPPTGSYTAELLLPENGEFAHAGVTPSGVLVFTLGGDAAPQALLFSITDTVHPELAVHLHSNDCDCGHVNPHSITFTTTDALPVETSWQIMDHTQTRVLLEGEGNITAATLADFYRTAGEGLYVIRVVATDAAGNSMEQMQTLRVVNGPVAKNEYA